MSESSSSDESQADSEEGESQTDKEDDDENSDGSGSWESDGGTKYNIKTEKGEEKLVKKASSQNETPPVKEDEDSDNYETVSISESESEEEIVAIPKKSEMLKAN